MADWFYRLIRTLGRPVFSRSSSPVVLHADRIPAGGAILAPNHLSPYDIPCLMASTQRVLDFVTITEISRRPLIGRFFAAMNAFPLDRTRVDAAATRVMLQRLQSGRLVVIFPEGRIRQGRDSMLVTGEFRQTLLRLGRLAQVPLVPCVLLGTGAYARASAWRGGHNTRYAVAFGEPLWVSDEQESLPRVREAYVALYAQLQVASGLTIDSTPWRPAMSVQAARASRAIR